MSAPPPNLQKGRGAASGHPSQRFGLAERHADGDWLDAQIADQDMSPVRTQVTIEHPKSILSFNRSPDIPFDRSINAYRGCEHGCIYCFARPTHAYHDLSPGLDFETKLFAKPDAGRLLRETFSKKGYTPRPIAIGTNTDPYQPIERRFGITRDILEICDETSHPIIITTKSANVLRDLEVLVRLAERELTAVAISVTTLDKTLARALEPRASSIANRLKAVAELSAAGVATHVNIAPIIPGLTDHELEAIAKAAHEAGARNISMIPLRLPHEVAPLFREWLGVHCPDRADKIMHRVQDIRGGRDNDPNFHSRMKGQGVWAELMRTRLAKAKRKHGFGSRPLRVRSDLFTPPQGKQLYLGL
jgi:DNA repair photolyase